MATDQHSTGAELRSDSWPETPEDAIAGLANRSGSPIDLIACALHRAHAVTLLLGSEFGSSDRARLHEDHVVNALWDIQGHLETARALLGRLQLAHRGERSANRSPLKADSGG